MNLAQRYIFKNLLKTFLLTIFVFFFLTFLTRVFHYLSIITEDGGSIKDFLLILILIQAKVFVIIAPFALLIASFITYSSLINANEHIAIYNMGAEKLSIIKPFFILAFLLFVLNFVFSSFFVPASYKKMNEIHARVAAKLSNSILKPGQFIQQNGLLIFINEAKQNKIAKGIIVVDKREKNKKSVIIASEGKMCFDGVRILFNASDVKTSRKTEFSEFPLISNFKKYLVSFEIKGFLRKTMDNSAIISTMELVNQVLTGDSSNIREFKVRFGWPFFVILIPFSLIACLLNFFNFARSKKQLSHIIASVFIVGYTSLSGTLGEDAFNNSIYLLFVYYANIILIFLLLLFKLRVKSF